VCRLLHPLLKKRPNRPNPNLSVLAQPQQVEIARNDHIALPFGGLLRTVGFWLNCRPPWVRAFRAVDSPAFFGGYDYRRVAVLPKNEHRFVLDCVEERAEAPLGSGNGNSLHIPV
jgi:hypothetical protein